MKQLGRVSLVFNFFDGLSNLDVIHRAFGISWERKVNNKN